MPNQWNGVIARQAVVWRGTSAVGVVSANPTFPVTRAIAGSAYSLNVTGGVSGTFSVAVISNIGGTTYYIAGVTAVGAAGAFLLYPFGYSSNGTVAAVPATTAVGDLNRLDQILPPTAVHFIANTATAGISANCTVAALIHTL